MSFHIKQLVAMNSLILTIFAFTTMICMRLIKRKLGFVVMLYGRLTVLLYSYERVNSLVYCYLMKTAISNCNFVLKLKGNECNLQTRR